MLRMSEEELKARMERLRRVSTVRTHKVATVEDAAEKPGPKPGKPSKVDDRIVIELDCASRGLPTPEREYRFHPHRKWRFDLAWITDRVALELEGGIWVQGRHTRGKGALDDMEKYNHAAAMGWRLLRCTPEQARKGEIMDLIEKALRYEGR